MVPLSLSDFNKDLLPNILPLFSSILLYDLFFFFPTHMSIVNIINLTAGLQKLDLYKQNRRDKNENNELVRRLRAKNVFNVTLRRNNHCLTHLSSEYPLNCRLDNQSELLVLFRTTIRTAQNSGASC